MKELSWPKIRFERRMDGYIYEQVAELRLNRASSRQQRVLTLRQLNGGRGDQLRAYLATTSQQLSCFRQDGQHRLVVILSLRVPMGYCGLDVYEIPTFTTAHCFQEREAYPIGSLFLQDSQDVERHVGDLWSLTERTIARRLFKRWIANAAYNDDFVATHFGGAK